MNEPSLSDMLETVWQHLIRGISDRRHPARHPTVATNGPHGPDLRTLVLRDIDRATSTLAFHTDVASPKTTHIAADPRIANHVWIPQSRLQIRARGIASLEPGGPALFAQLPPHAQSNYSGPIPGTPLSTTYFRAGPRFARLLCTLREIDVLSLSDPHRRARFRASDRWLGQWIAP